MDARMMEVLVFVDGVDAMTSKVMQARRNYMPSEMMLNEQVGVASWGVWRRCLVSGGGSSSPSASSCGGTAAGQCCGAYVRCHRHLRNWLT
jgi:hypothetical protein